VKVTAMPLKLKLDGLQAEISALDKLIEQATTYSDVIAEYQLTKRKKILQDEIDSLYKEKEKTASVALFFGGKPVLGSRGIAAEFAGSVLGVFQDLVSTLFSQTEIGSLGERGIIPLKDASRLMVTEVSRGSFGFVLDEMSDQMEIVDTTLKNIIGEVAKLLERTASPNELEFEEAVELLDSRTLLALKDFFFKLDTNDATLRIVEDVVDFTLDEASIRRGRQRTESTSINESEEYIFGVMIGFLPNHKKFEMNSDANTPLYGSVSKEAAEQYSNLAASGDFIIPKKCKIKIQRRIVRPLNRPAREVIRLLEFAQS
jgi:hypothetical protein